jgi:hypothetical protein
MGNGALQFSESMFNSRLSFGPLLNALKKNIAEGNPGMQILYGKVIKEFERHPELMGVIEDPSVLTGHEELIEELLSAVFPPTTANFMYGISFPFKNRAVYASPVFKAKLIDPEDQTIHFPSPESLNLFNQERLHFAYGLILKKYLGYNSPVNDRFVFPYQDDETGLTRFMEYRIDGRFLDVKPVDEMPEMPATILDHHTHSVMPIMQLMEQIPLEKFVFEGVFIIRINDTTDSEIITRIKNHLLENNLFESDAFYTDLENYIQCLIGLKDLTIGITPFFKINGHYVYSELHNKNSILFRKLDTQEEKDEISDYCKQVFRHNHQPVLYDNITEDNQENVQFLPKYYEQGARSIILCPLRYHEGLIGILEIISAIPGKLQPSHINKIEAALPLFTLELEKSLHQLKSEVDSVIKKKFTAVQPAVEWKFTETALHYIENKHRHEEARIERITFHDVYPLFGAIDIRNSSTERTRALTLDTTEQLQMALNIVKKAQGENEFPLLQEVGYKIEKYLAQSANGVDAEEEIGIREFFKQQVTPLFNNLKETQGSLKNDIDNYISNLDEKMGMLYKHRHNYESSISKINDTLAHFVDAEQLAAQKLYPHFFERFVTDGLEFNIHLGQSISPRKRYDEIYLHNLRMWQLTMMARAAMLTHRLEKELKHPLQTTQLILAYNQPLSICFRTEEKKFDVDGAQHTRYEIVKKRIDKAHIKNTDERITQPGKISIVYSQGKDVNEYTEYIEFLQDKKFLQPGIEKHDVEPLQGVVGLKLLRVDVAFEE